MNLNVARVFTSLVFVLPTLMYPQTETIGKYTQEDNDRMEKMQPRTLVPKIKNAFVFPHWIGTSDEFWSAPDCRWRSVCDCRCVDRPEPSRL